jgi:hypothetical protein
MKLIVAGSRTIPVDFNFVWQSISSLVAYRSEVEELVSGGCPNGPDKAAKDLAQFHWHCKYKEFPAVWDLHGKAAGPIRNRQMAEYGDALLLIWDGKSRGSTNMKKEMLALGKPVYEVIISRHNLVKE